MTIVTVGIDLAKNDFAVRAVHAAAICAAVTRPNRRFVPLKSIDQQALLPVRRVRHAACCLTRRSAAPAHGCPLHQVIRC